jgi:hypothetical protein
MEVAKLGELQIVWIASIEGITTSRPHGKDHFSKDAPSSAPIKTTFARVRSESARQRRHAPA